MSEDDTLVADKKDKKRSIFERNKKNLRIFRQVNEQLEIAEDVREKEEELREKMLARPEGEETELWSAKTQEIRNRINGKKRASLERWNRFAGTEGGGGRGR